MTAELLITLIFLVIVLIAILYIISIWVYKRAPANMGFIRTGYLGTKVCLGRGAMVLPVFHEVTWVSLETLKLIVSRSRDQAVLTSDKIRIDVVAELYAHVGRSEDDLLAAARSLGERTFDTEKVRMLLEAKIVSALRSYAATKTLSELHENRDIFAKAVQSSVVESFHANGLTLEEVTIVTLEQSAKDFFDKDNVFDAEGLKVITAITSDARRQVHNTEKRTTVSIRQRELDTQLELLEIEKQEAFARANQDARSPTSRPSRSAASRCTCSTAHGRRAEGDRQREGARAHARRARRQRHRGEPAPRVGGDSEDAGAREGAP